MWGGRALSRSGGPPCQVLHIVGALAVLAEVETFQFDFLADTQAGDCLGDEDGDHGSVGGPDNSQTVAIKPAQQLSDNH